ncbi:hypothetical protein CgunFtcFv8_015150 [Champsocephalus gunnari]|uniref:Synaptonemal complex protein 2 Spt16M-like domain-containing protein n=1 Tax=Champsocephalus gunnari TaxID=52237 RepID=A0AAN8C640_CHAGU|nr:hypothetical protein CgunFtcFv8_015150 [Champsocephalus gunnari]
MITTGGLLRINRRQDSLRSKSHKAHPHKKKKKKKKRNEVVVVKGKLQLVSVSAFVAALGIMVLLGGVVMAALGYWPREGLFFSTQPQEGAAMASVYSSSPSPAAADGQLLGQSLPVIQLSVVLLQLAGFSLETGIIFHLRLEGIRTLNSILESLSREQRRQVQNQNQNHMLSQLAAAVLTVGDYELQVSLSEALCRLTPMKERRLRANQWFPNRDISSSFCDIRDRDFEVDCRSFLNFVNSNHGDQRRVYTFPCRQAFLDSTELFPPKDDKLDEFWIDFNVGSECVSFFIDEPQGFLWGSFHLQQEEVDLYSLKECSGAEAVLSVRLKFPIMHRDSPGQVVQLRFDSQHLSKLQEAMGRVFMKVKCSSDGTVQVSPPADEHNGRSYRRKKAKSKLKVLPMSFPSSEEDSPVPKVNQGELLFDQIVHSSPTLSSGLPEGAELQTSPVQNDMFGGDLSFIPKEGFGSGRKRSALDSGYLSDQTEGPLGKTRREEPEAKGEEPVSEGDGVEGEEPVSEGDGVEGEEPVSEGDGVEGEAPEWEEPEPEGEAPEWEGPEPEGEEPEGEEPNSLQTESLPEWAGPVGGAEPGSHMMSDITAALNTFNSQLDHHFTGCWKNVETEILQSLTKCQQHVSSLLTAVHQHR